MPRREVGLPSYDGQPEGTELFLVCRRFDQNRAWGVVLGFIREEVFSLFLHTGGLRVVERLRERLSLHRRRFVSQ